MLPRLGWPLPGVFAHRCGGALAPENTLAGLHIAAGLGLRAVEFDVMLSADGSPWLLHDEALARTTNGDGLLCETPDSALCLLDAGAYRHPAFAGEPLPTLESAALACRRLGLLANVEIKPAAGFEERTGEVVARRVIELWSGTDLPLVSSFSRSALAAARAAAPELPLGSLYERVPSDWPVRLRELGALTLHCRADLVDDEMLGEARAAGVPVLCYTVNDPALATALFARGVTAVFSDRIDRIREHG
ncbi:MAG: glycerophosphodiester phosphodiesterase [Candidatus Accumulibacter sp.]|uniref:glycerophosphodiester phosphodiesterase n=1 Tax=Accumulibacter sp. TaxID=2053492 RepID=UPI001A5275FC|nr:glycerophosphodiester phosphodiesterase [Accumulibacter sp.]MBL8395358.1 glycerophosphodiester phosphodiesterase [Accumulibacter sp.]